MPIINKLLRNEILQKTIVQDYKAILYFYVFYTMHLPYFIAKYIAQPTAKTFSSFIVKVCIVSTAISVATMVVTTCMFDGFEQSVSQKFMDCWGNIHVMNYNSLSSSFTQQDELLYDSSLVKNIHSLPNIKTINAFSIRSTIIKTKTDIEGILLKGIDKNYDWQRFQNFMVEGNSINYVDSGYSKQIVLSKSIASKLNIKTKDSITLFFIAQGTEMPKARKVQVCGLYQTGLEENDKTFALIDNKLVARINNDTLNKIFGYEITVNDKTKLTETNNEIFDKYLTAPLKSYTIQERFANVFQWIQLIKEDVKVIYIIMLIVALINIVTSILILILERTNMIGILKSLGMRNASIQQIFVWQSAYIALMGIGVGVTFGVLLCLVQQHYPFLHLDPKIYLVKDVQIFINPIKIIVIALCTLLLSTIMLFLPSMIVYKITPIKALRFD